MTSRVSLRVSIAAAVIAAFISVPASAQATRTWVSGVGDDANPCSRTAPCKTFAGAISKTAAGGEISVLDPGGFGAVTITKSITISGDGTLASILAAGTNGVIVNAAATDRIVLRSLSIEGAGTGLNGIRFLAGGALHVEGCTINGFTTRGIDMQPSGSAKLFVSNTVIRNVGENGINVVPGAGATVTGAISNVRLERNAAGLRTQNRTNISVRDTVASGNTFSGFIVAAPSAEAKLALERCTAVGNGPGVRVEGSFANVRMTECTVTGNSKGLDIVNGGKIWSWGNNYVDGNFATDLPNGDLTPQ